MSDGLKEEDEKLEKTIIRLWRQKKSLENKTPKKADPKDISNEQIFETKETIGAVALTIANSQWKERNLETNMQSFKLQ